MTDEVFWCTTCLNMSTRPRITFDSQGRCNACQWAEQKRTFDWDSRKVELKNLLDANRSDDGSFDCVVPVSGGKDGSYIAYQLKAVYGMNPLCITVTPPLPTQVGSQNILNFIGAGFDLIQLNPSAETMQKLNRAGFIENGLPYFGWLAAIEAAVPKYAARLGIKLVFYSEEGETEYGGTTKLSGSPFYTPSFQGEVYLESGFELVANSAGVTSGALDFYSLMTDTEFSEQDMKIAHWSYFEDWNPYYNYLVAKEYCGLVEETETNLGTFTNYAQNDQDLYALHTYLMYLKFGFGRATQDAGIDIRRGAMTRDQAVNLVKFYDGQYPEQYIDTYLKYFKMSLEEFEVVLDKWANRKLFKKVGRRWQPTFKII